MSQNSGKHVAAPFAESSSEEVSAPVELSARSRFFLIFAALLALFLGALDAMVMSAAMPTIVSEVGGLHLYSWVFSAYLLARAVSLPVFGKLADLFTTKSLYLVSIGVFLIGSLLAGAANSMLVLVVSRILQGIGAGGNFALAMVVLTDISSPGKRGKTLSLGSFVWGLASVIGPTFGGFVVTYFSWRWIFFINIPLGILSLLGIYFYLVEIRQKTKDAAIDYLGVLTMTTAIIALLTAFLIGGRTYEWISPQILGLLFVAVASSLAFIHVEINAREPILSLQFFRGRGFSAGNGVSFFSSFAIFSLFGFSPLYIQGTLAKSPMQLGFAMLALSFGWSAGALLCGQLIHLLHKKPSVLLGASLLVIGCALTLTFTSRTSLLTCVFVFGIIGLGMGFVSIASLIVVQDSLQTTQVGVATGSHQFARSVGGTLGIGLCGSLVTAKLSHIFDTMQNSGMLADLSAGTQLQIQQNFENLFRPEVQSRLEPELLDTLQAAVGQGVMLVNWVVLLAALIAFSFSLRIPSSEKRS